MASTATRNGTIREYLKRVEELYGSVRDWMSDRPGIKFLRGETRLNEQYSGPYKARVLKVAQAGGPAFTFVPKGAYSIGDRGQVDVEGPLGSESLVWVEEGAPGIAFRELADGRIESLRGRPMFPGVPEGWAWVDSARRRLVHLDRDVFLKDVIGSLSE